MCDQGSRAGEKQAEHSDKDPLNEGKQGQIRCVKFWQRPGNQKTIHGKTDQYGQRQQIDYQEYEAQRSFGSLA